MGKIESMRGKRAASVAMLVAIAGCASGPRQADESAIELGRKVVMDSVPLAGLAVQALVSSGTPQDKATYRTDNQRFCAAGPDSLDRARQAFSQLCAVKGAVYDGRFCLRSADDVPFMARFERAGNGGCYTLVLAEPKPAADTAEYVGYLVEQGYVTEARRQHEFKTQQESARVRAETQRQIDQTRMRAEEARLAMELATMKKRGTRVCKIDGDRMLSGFVEDSTDEKVKVLVTGGYLVRMPSMQVQIPPGTLTWDYFIAWRLC